jgi:hypothetical protein
MMSFGNYGGLWIGLRVSFGKRLCFHRRNFKSL